MKVITGIYKIENMVNHKVYIGQSKNIYTRWNTHKYKLNKGTSPNKYLQNAYNKYGKDNFEFSIICECKEEELNEKEKFYISFYKSTDRKYGYNLESGGNDKFHGTPLKEYEDYIINRFKNDERFSRIQELLEDAKIKWSRKKDVKNGKIVLINTGEIFDSVCDAVKKYPQCDRSTILKCCKPKYANNRCGTMEDGTPMVWMFLDEYSDIKKEDIGFWISFSIHRNLNYPTTKYVICLNNYKIFKSYAMAGLYCGVEFQTIWSACTHSSHTAGEDPETGERLVWRILDENFYDSLYSADVTH